MFGSAKRIRYRWLLADLDGEINKPRAEKVTKLNERHIALNLFIFWENGLYCRPLKVGRAERLVVCDYNAAEIIEKVHGQLDYAGNSKTFAEIKQFDYGINKQMFEW